MTLHEPRPDRGSTPRASGALHRKTVSIARWLRLPGTTATPECASIRYWERPTRPGSDHERSPVLFVHGYAGTEHIFAPLRAALTNAGFDCLIALRYNAFRADIHQVADWLVDQAQRSMVANGSTSVHLVGHSLGGLVVRDAAQHRGLAGLARTVVTIATPHAGATLARFVPGPAARQMRPGSTFLAELDAGRADHRTRWIAIHGDADRIVPKSSNPFGRRSPTVLTLRQPATGHGSVARHPDVVDYITGALLRAEQQAGISVSLAA